MTTHDETTEPLTRGVVTRHSDSLANAIRNIGIASDETGRVSIQTQEADMAKKKHSVNGAIVVDKGVPMPKARHKYPWKELEIGDSFFVPDATRCVQTGAAAAAKIHRIKLCTRTVVENGTTGLRVWRTA